MSIPTLVTVATTRDARTVHVAEHLEHGLTLGELTLCGRTTARMRADTWSPSPTCRVCTIERNRLLSAARTAPAERRLEDAVAFLDTLGQRAEVVDLAARRGGHPGPARVSMSARFTPGQLIALDGAVAAGYASSRGGVIGRLIDEAHERELAR